MEALPHSPGTALNIASSFPVQKHHNYRQPSKSFFDPKNFISITKSSEGNKSNPSRASFSLTQQNFNELLNSSFSLSLKLSPQNASLSRARIISATISTATTCNSIAPSSGENVHWVVILDKPPDPEGFQSEAEIMNYYVRTLQKALGSEEDAQSSIYDAFCDSPFGFCCKIDEETSRILAGLPGVLSVKPDPDMNSVKDYSAFNLQANSVSSSPNRSTLLFPKSSKQWLVRVGKPSVGVVSKAQVVDYYVNILTQVLGNEKDAQMCLYHISWLSDFGFCCQLDEESAQELATLPEVLSVHPDEHCESENKDYGGKKLSFDAPDSTQTTEISKTKLFITGLSFYTSEKTLRAAFEPFGELVEVKVIMNKISKRSKGYAFLEYSTEDAATIALQEMNGKIINGWMIVVDRARSKPRYSRGRPRH